MREREAEDSHSRWRPRRHPRRGGRRPAGCDILDGKARAAPAQVEGALRGAIRADVGVSQTHRS